MKPEIPASFTPQVSVIIPARNEEANIGRCLRSILAQQGIAFQVIVVDDHSTDRTSEIARQVAQEFDGAYDARRPRVIIMQARRPLPAGWTGKANALCSAVPLARGDWLLFTDADTEHAPASLAAAVQEAEQHAADVFSLSPEQEVEGFWERALMPVIFSELASTFRPRDVSDPTKPVAAANGQYLLIRRGVYQEVGGHAAVAGDLLEDVALARRVKGSGYVLLFRMGKGMVRTHMYRGLRQMREGWTKNLALLFPDASSLACRRMAEFAALVALPPAAAGAWLAKAGPLRYALLGATAVVWGNFLLRTRRAHFDALSTALAVFGLPLFAGLLLRSAKAHRDDRVEWKGRRYHVSPASVNFSIRKATADDATGILQCLAEAFQPYRARYTADAFTDTVLTPETLRQRLSSMHVFVATADREPPGAPAKASFAVAGVEQIVGTIACNVVSPHEGHIRGMAVRPKWQGHCVAARLLSSVEAELRDRECSLISLDTTAPLEGAMRFYERNGFRRSGKVTDFFDMPLFEYVKALEPKPRLFATGP